MGVAYAGICGSDRMEIRGGDKRTIIRQGDITREETDAIVCPAISSGILLSVAREFLGGETSLETVVFCNHDDETCRISQERAGTLGREAWWHPAPVYQNPCKTAFSEGSAYEWNPFSDKHICGIMEPRVKPPVFLFARARSCALSWREGGWSIGATDETCRAVHSTDTAG